jgi:hypothetical protein
MKKRKEKETISFAFIICTKKKYAHQSQHATNLPDVEKRNETVLGIFGKLSFRSTSSLELTLSYPCVF